MKRAHKNSDLPIGDLKQVPDFLPPPEDLVVPNETVKVTLALTKSSLDFFKREARKHHTKYQRMIRDIVDKYAKKYA